MDLMDEGGKLRETINAIFIDVCVFVKIKTYFSSTRHDLVNYSNQIITPSFFTVRSSRRNENELKTVDLVRCARKLGFYGEAIG